MRIFYPRFAKSWLLIFVIAVIGMVRADAQSPSPSLDSNSQPPPISELIEQLGDPRYSERSFAERSLQRLGLAAFDELLKATKHADPEIAATSQRLLSAATKDWHRDSDPDLVQLHLIRYARRSPSERLLALRLINRLPDQQGVEALCRLARYETSEEISKAAAAALLQSYPNSEKPLTSSHLDAMRRGLEVENQSYGPSNRLAVEWLNVRVRETQDSNYWFRAAEDELKLVRQNSPNSNQQIVESLLWTALGCAVENGDETLIVEVTDRLIQLNESETATRLLSVSKRLEGVEAWRTLATVLEKYEPQLQDRRGLYLRARFALQSGDVDLAARLADQALATPTGGDTLQLASGSNTEYRQRALLLGERVMIAEELDKESHPDGVYREWACRELEAASRTLDPLSVSVVYARWTLGELRHDSEEYSLAAESLTDLVELITSGKDQRRHFSQLPQQAMWLTLPDQGMLTSQRWLYEALASHRERDMDQAEEALEKSYDADSTNADVLIAMYRLENRSLEYMTKVRNRILESCRRIELEIAQDPTSPTPYNHWAWLVSNTEGDYAKAVRYSQRSLELAPNNPGYLDTLGCCFYAAGRIDEAIEAQQRAVDQMPSMQIMRRQLEKFYEARDR